MCLPWKAPFFPSVPSMASVFCSIWQMSPAKPLLPSFFRGLRTAAPHGWMDGAAKVLEQTVHLALNEVVAILGFSLNPDDRAFSSILKAKTTILSAVLNAQVRIDETRFETGKKDRLEGILAAAERSLSHLERAYGR